MPTLRSIQIGQPKIHEPVAGDTSNKPWTTGFFKSTVEAPIKVAETGLAGDAVADTRVHGGRDKAICCYSAGHWPYWREQLNEPKLGPAAFGENFSITGLNEANVCLGDVWSIGSAKFEISQPRQPCWKLARRWRQKELTLWVQQTGYSGWYLRVLEPGTVTAGEAIHLEARTEPDWTIARANEVMYQLKDDAEATKALAAVKPLAASWKRQLRKRLK